MNYTTIIRLITSRFGDYRTSGNDICVNCPFCILRGKTQDVKYKLWINPKKDAAHCFRCEYKSKCSLLFPQLASLGVEFDKTTKRLDDANLEALPSDCHILSELPSTHLCRQYLEGRGFGIRDFDVPGAPLYCEDYKKGSYSFGPRLIFPVYQFGVYRGFQGRTIWKNTDPKYVNASGMSKKTVLYNFDNAFKQKNELVVVEGVFDVPSTGVDRTVASFGKAVSDEQIRLIALGDFQRIIMFLDPDAQGEGMSSAKKLAKNHDTFVCRLHDKDPGELKKDEIEFLFRTELRKIY